MSSNKSQEAWGRIIAKAELGGAITDGDAIELFRACGPELIGALKQGASELDRYGYGRVKLSYLVQCLKLVEDLDAIKAAIEQAEELNLCVSKSWEDYWRPACEEDERRRNVLAVIKGKIYGPANFQNGAQWMLLAETVKALRRINRYQDPATVESKW